MASQFYVPGPAQVFIGQAACGVEPTWSYLGYSQNGVDCTLYASYQDVICDISGPSVPIDAQFMGEQAFITMTLNYYQEAILQTIAKRRVSNTVTVGAVENNGLGSLMISQAYFIQTLILSPYAGLTFQSATAVPYFWFQSGWLHDQMEVPTSVLVKAPRITLRHIPCWNTTSGALNYALYKTSGLGSIPTPV